MENQIRQEYHLYFRGDYWGPFTMEDLLYDIENKRFDIYYRRYDGCNPNTVWLVQTNPNWRSRPKKDENGLPMHIGMCLADLEPILQKE